MEKIQVSVLCLAYNQEKYIQKALDSILSQKTVYSYEIIIHDDASTDIIKEYEKLYPGIVKPIYQKENQYSKGARILHRYVYPKARGEYIAYLECDDYWTSELKLQKQVDFLNKNPEYIGCVHKCEIVNQNDEVKEIKTFAYYENAGEYTFNDFFKQELPGQIATLVHRNILKEYPANFYNSTVQGDLLTYLFLLTNGKIYRMQESMSAYRFVQIEGGDSWSSQQLSKVIGYTTWNNLRSLEGIYKDTYGKKINFKKRKRRAVLIALKELIKRHSAKDIIRVAKMIIVQRGVLLEAINIEMFEKHLGREENGKV